MYDSTMTRKDYAHCVVCGYEGPGVRTFVEPINATDGAYHIFTACAYTKACSERVEAQAQEAKHE